MTMSVIEQAAALAEGFGAGWGGYRSQPGPQQSPHQGPWPYLSPFDVSREDLHRQYRKALDPFAPGSSFNAAEAFRRARMQQVQYGTQASSGPYLPPRPQAGGLHGAEENMNLIEQAAGLGAMFAGLGVLGPLGNVGSITAGKYQSTGDGVYFRKVLEAGLPAVANSLSIGDVVEATGEVGGVKDANGAFINFAKVGHAQYGTGWVAIEYLAPNGTVVKPQRGNIEPVKLETAATSEMDYTPWILGGAAVVGIGIIGWAVLAKPKRGGHRRRAHA